MRAKRVLVLAVALAFLAGCRRAPQAPEDNGEKAPSLIFQGFGLRASHRGQLVWQAQAARARVYDLEHRALAEDVTLTYFVDGKAVSKGKALRARLDLKGYDLQAEGDVQVRGANGVLLKTSRLDWDNKAQRASSSAPVRLLRGGAILTGVGFSADRELRDVRILSNVQAEAASIQELRREAAAWPGL